MAPTIRRPRSDRPKWAMITVFAAASLLAGYLGGRHLFAPGVPPPGSDEEAPESASSVRDASRGDDASAPRISGAEISSGSPDAAAAGSVRTVSVTIARSTLQSCGDGEELNLLGARCAPVAGLEPALRHHLLDLGTCPAAEAAAAKPDEVLSIGLRVDFARRRVTALPGRSSSVHNALTFVPCARVALDNAEDLWRLQPEHPRYLYFFSVRFGPLGLATTASPSRPSSPSASASALAVAARLTSLSSSPPPDEARVVWSRVILRDAPRSGAVVAHLRQGEVVRVLGHRTGWWQVQSSSATGWVYGGAIDRR